MAVQSPWASTVITEWLAGKTFKAMLLDNASAHDSSLGTTLDVTELSTSGYTPGGLALDLAVEFGLDNSLTIVGDPATLDFGAITATIGGLAVYDTDSQTLVYIDWFGGLAANGAGFTYTLPPDGVVNVVVG